jgi:chorismate mutase
MIPAALLVRAVLVTAALALTTTAVPAPARADEQLPLYALVDAAATRLQTADDVAASKWTTGGSIEDPAREREVLDAVAAAATERGVDPNYVTAAFRNQIDATVGVEYALFGDWKLDPASAPTAAPNLANSRSTIDALNRTMVSEIAGQWDSLHSSGCPAELQAARDAVAVARHLDELYQRGLTLATRSYCQ